MKIENASRPLTASYFYKRSHLCASGELGGGNWRGVEGVRVKQEDDRAGEEGESIRRGEVGEERTRVVACHGGGDGEGEEVVEEERTLWVRKEEKGEREGV